MLLLNLFRMSFISLVWAYYGISSALGVFHEFAGQLLFYAVIIVMILLAGRYGMNISRIKHDKSTKDKTDKKSLDRRLLVPAVLAIAFGVIGFILSSQYSSAVYAPALFFNGSSANSIVSRATYMESMTNSLEQANVIVIRFGDSGSGVLFAISQISNSMSNSTGSKTAYVIATPLDNPESGWLSVNYTAQIDAESYVLRNGITMTDEIVASGGQDFDVDYFALPYNYSGTYATINYEVFRQITNSSAPLCGIDNYATLGIPNYIESSVYNMLRMQSGGGERKFTCYSYKIASS